MQTVGLFFFSFFFFTLSLGGRVRSLSLLTPQLPVSGNFDDVLQTHALHDKGQTLTDALSSSRFAELYLCALPPPNLGKWVASEPATRQAGRLHVRCTSVIFAHALRKESNRCHVGLY